MLFKIRSLGPQICLRTNSSRSRVGGRRARRPGIEMLEGRALLSFTVDITTNASTSGSTYFDGFIQSELGISPVNVNKALNNDKTYFDDSKTSEQALDEVQSN